jgi:hypothetical protein
MIPQINILTVVDVIGALAAGTLTGNMTMSANRRGPGQPMSAGALASAATFAQVINWQITTVDVQTNVRINKITFYKNGKPIADPAVPCAALRNYGAPSGDYWAGVINFAYLVAPGTYQYLMELDMGRKTMVMEEFASITISAPS